jgi:DNA-binding NarL/FixJ family response regulator
MTIARRVLVVDDERFFREAIRDALVGVSPCSLAENGEEALKLAEDPAVEAVVLDMRMPRSSGVDVLKELRKRRPALQVIVLSEPADQSLVLEALRLGASDYLAKPLHDEELRLAVARALSATRLGTRWDLLRGRLLRLREVFAELEDAVRGEALGDRLALLAPRVVQSVAGVLGAARASLLVREGDALRVVALVGGNVALSDLTPVPSAQSLAGLAFGADEVLRIEEVERDERCAGRPRRGQYASGCTLLAPLDVETRPFGVICVADPYLGRPFGAEDASLLAVLAAQIGSLLGGGSPPESETPAAAVAPAQVDPQETQRVELLREVCEAMTREVEPEALLRATLAPIAECFDAVVSVYLADGRSGQLVRAAQCERGSRSDRSRLPRDRGLTGLVAQTGRLVAVVHPESESRFDPLADTPEDGRPGPLFCLPLTVRGKVLGVARILPPEGMALPARTAEVLVPALSAAVRNALLYRSLVESIEDVARARREAGSQRGR